MRSYADSVREELLEVPVKRPCCRRALVGGLLLDASRSDKLITVTYKQEQTAAFAAGELRRRFGKMPETERVSAYGRTRWILRFASPASEKLLKQLDCGALDEDVISSECESCRSAFLRGAFLACATVNDPQKSTHLEFLLKDPARATLLSAFLSETGYVPKEMMRESGNALYFKDATSLEDLLALMGAGKMSMEMMNFRIEREIRNQENRATNCVAKNIEKSVSASARQMAAIEKLTVTGMLAQLPDAIRLTARLRAENPDASLEELRNLHNPPITKSGLNHRLQKILSEADKI